MGARNFTIVENRRLYMKNNEHFFTLKTSFESAINPQNDFVSINEWVAIVPITDFNIALPHQNSHLCKALEYSV